MNISDLPKGSAPAALNFEHFPTVQQAFVWRNWGLVKAERLAEVIETTSENVIKLAEGMGLDPLQKVQADWLAKGYVTIIRCNWHLLPYKQLLTLLGWSVEKLDYMLREEDFLYHKLGSLKPQCSEIKYEPLNKNQNEQTAHLRESVTKYFSNSSFEYTQKPFSFYGDLPEPPKHKETLEKFSSKIVYAYSAPYGDTLLADENDLYPEILLERLAANGVNGIWLQAVLYTLMPWDRAPELSEGYQQRLKNLQALVERAKKYNIGVYLYINEPRPMPESFFEKNQDWPRGVAHKDGPVISLCTSQPQTLQFVSDACKFVFENVPELKGVITITMSENLVHCHARGYGDKCPRCSKRTPEEIVVELNSTISKAVHQAAPKAKVIVWTWAWDDKWSSKAVDMLPDNVELMCVSEWGLPTNIGGVEGSVMDYSISQVGPSETSLKLWERAKERGLKTHAKVQMNNSWECSAMPYIPVAPLVEEHLNNLRNAEIDGILASWTLGGYPGGNLPLLKTSAEKLAGYYGGEHYCEEILRVWDKFAQAFKEFPFSMAVLYYAPQNAGPANLLFDKPTGHQATMVGIPYDDLELWRSIYPEGVFEKQWESLSRQWLEGLNLLDEIKNQIPKANSPAFEDMNRVAQACYCHFASTWNQVAFIRQRNAGCNKMKLIEILDREIELAKQLEQIVLEDSRIGFEATNHYIYTPNDLREKVINCEHLKQRIVNDES